MNSTQDWFMMTGDLIINLRSTKTGDAFMLNPKNKNKSHILDGNQNQIKQHDDSSYLNQALDSPEDGNDQSLPKSTDSNEIQCSLNEEPSSEEQEQQFNLDNISDHNEEVADQNKNTFASSATSNSSSGNSSGIADEELSHSQSFSDGLNSSSPSKQYNNDNNDFCYFYGNYDDKNDENCYENIGECNYLNRSQESNLYNMIEDSKSFDNVSIDSDNGSLVCYNYSSIKHQCVDGPSASRLAKRLYNLEGFQKSDVARHLSKNNEFSRAVAEEYLKLFDFTGQQLDEAMRTFLSHFYLIGETQERERVLVYFSKRFNECNQDANFKSVDSIHTLTCALMLLNTDLHEETIQRKMTCTDFIINLSGLNDGDNFSSDLLTYLYHSIKNKPLGWNKDEIFESTRKDRNVFSKITTISKSISSPYATLPRKCNTLSLNPFVDVPNPTFAIEYKKGYIRRKCCYEANGRRTSLGKRSWRMFYATLRDLVLYLHKDENGFRKSQLEESFANSIRIHHSIASVADDYLKKKFVFRLITADHAEYLFETSDSRELQAWVDAINTTAASLSAPALPMAVSSDNYKFKREIFPVSHTKLSLRDQFKDQENKLLSLQKELELLLEKSGQSSTKKSYQKGFMEKETYLQREVKRYRVYITCLSRKLHKQADQQSLSDYQMANNDCPSLNKSICSDNGSEIS